MNKLMTLLATLALVGAFSAVSFAQQDQSSPATPQDQSVPSTTQDQTTPSAQQSGTQDQSAQPASPSQNSPSSMQSSQGSTFTGTVVKAGDMYVLKTSDMSYQLDDQKKAKRFAGKQVTVTGALDSNTSTIHVMDIGPAS